MTQDHDTKTTIHDFHQAVNMTPKVLEDWLATEESRKVGWVGGEAKHAAGGAESVGHKSGERIVEILRRKQTDLSDDDLAHMRKVTGYVHRHLAQKPDKPDDELGHTRWRASLMNWGHDPL